MKLFSFVFDGEIEQGANAAKVVSALTKRVGQKSSLWQSVVERKALFKLEGLDHFVALQFQERFRSTGALGRIEPTYEQLPTQYESEHCPSCGSMFISHNQCSDCGVFIAKFWQQLLQKYETRQVTPDENNAELASQTKLRSWFKRSALLLSGGFIANYYLKDSSMLFLLGMNSGIWPFIPGYLSLIYFINLLMASKNRTGLLQWLGVFYLPGLALALLIPRQGEAANVQFKNVALFIICVIFSVYSLSIFKADNQQRQNMTSEVATLQLNRFVYPDTQIHNNVSIFDSEYQEVTQFLTNTLEYLTSNSLAIKDVETLLNASFNAMADYMAWWHHQQMLYARAHQNIPIELQYNWRRKGMDNWVKLFEKYYNSDSDPKHLMLVQAGFVGRGETMAGRNILAEQLNIELMNIFKQFRDHQLTALLKESEPVAVNYDSAVIQGQRFQVDFTPPYLTIRSDRGPLSATPLVFGVYNYKYEKNRKTQYSMQINRIDNALSDQYIYANNFRLIDGLFQIKNPAMQ